MIKNTVSIFFGVSTIALALLCWNALSSRKRRRKSAKEAYSTKSPAKNDCQLLKYLSSAFWSSDSKKQLPVSENDLWNTVIFFPDWFPDEADTPTRQLIWYLDQASLTIDLCLYSLNFKMIENALIHLAKEDEIRIRVLTDKRLRCDKDFIRAGILTRTKDHKIPDTLDPKKFADLLHHKFVVIDSTAVIAGSLNWTMSSITENFENVVVTTQPQIVSKLSTEFERLWDESSTSVVRRRRNFTGEKNRQRAN